MSKSRTDGKRGARQPSSQSSAPAVPGGAVRETIESIAVAVVLAFLFRAFVAEAFVIPTGSMAPTLMGAHKDVECPECGCWYQTGASIEGREEEDLRQGRIPRPEEASRVVATVCPVCRYPQLLDIAGEANKATFSGDRILVSKFIYDFTQPKRWDVIVFKYPLSAKQNFIKRLIGLPGESVLIQRGDIYIKAPGQEEFRIARKPDGKLEAMLQLVDDSKYISQRLTEVNWPRRWQPWSEPGTSLTDSWTTDDNGHSYYVDASEGGDRWLRYHHVVPNEYDWAAIRQMAAAGQQLDDPQSYVGSLITDFYAYNTGSALPVRQLPGFDPKANFEDVSKFQHGQEAAQREAWQGLYWVGDLALEGEVDLQSDTGSLLLQLTKGGEDFRCAIDIATGMATLSINSDAGVFVGDDGVESKAPHGQTRIQGPGSYAIRYSNVDAEIRLWVNGTRVLFDGPTAYLPRIDAQPITSDEDPGDLAPLGIGAGERLCTPNGCGCCGTSTTSVPKRPWKRNTRTSMESNRSGRYWAIRTAGGLRVCLRSVVRCSTTWAPTSSFRWETTARRARTLGGGRSTILDASC